MIFNSLDEALQSIDTITPFNIDCLIQTFHIRLHYSEELPRSINGFVFPLTRTIFVNSMSHDKTFVKYHEFIHCLVDDSVEPLVESSYVSNTKIEHRANVGALSIMIKEYMTILDIDARQFNVMQFQQYYGLQDKYLYDVASVFESVLNMNIDNQFWGINL